MSEPADQPARASPGPWAWKSLAYTFLAWLAGTVIGTALGLALLMAVVWAVKR